jgi:pimeloyl-ACP methyl ester carboxylesterase
MSDHGEWDNRLAMLHVRQYGTSGSYVVVLHGGPGIPGYMAPIARGLADSYRVLEPFQRGSGDKPLTVGQHIEDLLEVINFYAGDSRPALIGSSWGAMLALAFAATYPESSGGLVLVGCGTFDPVARAAMQEALKSRMDESVCERLQRLEEEFAGKNDLMKALADFLLPLYSYDLITTNMEDEGVDARAYQQTWQDMLRFQAEGLYPAAFASIKAPVLMLHGVFDPHPGRLIRANLESYLPQLEYREFESCGHYPWLEKSASEEFFSVLRNWLEHHLNKSHRTGGRVVT